MVKKRQASLRLWWQALWWLVLRYGVWLGLICVPLPPSIQAQNQPPCQPDGKVTQDNLLTPADALLTFRHFLGNAMPALDTCQMVRANVVAPETSPITPDDALCIFRRFLNLPSCLDIQPSSTSRLLRVSGNNQSGQPGQLLAEPLVVRLEDQFGNPLVGAGLTAETIRGDGRFVDAPVTLLRHDSRLALPEQTTGGAMRTVLTDASGEARFFLQLGSDTQDVVVQVAALEFPQVRPVQFFAIVGAVDTPDVPEDLVVSGDVVYIADRFSGLQIITVSDPRNPRRLDPVDLPGTLLSLALAGNRLYVASRLPSALVILDITTPTAPVVLGSVAFPTSIETHSAVGVAVQGSVAYVATEDRPANSGALFIADISNPANSQGVVVITNLPGRPTDIAIAGSTVYIPGAAGLLLFDVSTPGSPSVSAPLPQLDGAFESGITLSGSFAYVVERHDEQSMFTVLDLHNPALPQRRGAVQLPMVIQRETRFPIALSGPHAYVGVFAAGLQAITINNPDAPRLVGRIDTPSLALGVTVADPFVYVTDLIFGLQVIQGAGATPLDTDGDGVADFFDAFPTDPAESQDTDGDHIGDNTDLDDDNDTFTDAEERQANPPTDPTDLRDFPLLLPPAGTTTLVVDATSSATARQRNGTPAAPYRSVSEGLRAVRALEATGQALTLEVRAGTYSPEATQEIFPLDLSRLVSLTIRGASRATTVIDAGFTGDVIIFTSATSILIEELTLLHGANGILGNNATMITIRRNRIAEHNTVGINLGINSNAGNTIADNIVELNGERAIDLFENATATITGNMITNNTNAGLVISDDSIAELITMNSITSNQGIGVQIQNRSHAILTHNTIAQNGVIGVFVVNTSTAEMTANTMTDNEGEGVEIGGDSIAILTENSITNQTNNGIVVIDNATAHLIANTIEQNGHNGVIISEGSEAIMTANTIVDNGILGIAIQLSSTATINEGTISRNAFEGIFLGVTSTARIALEGGTLTLSHNGGAGILVLDDGSVATINRAQIVFDDNAGGEIIGPVIEAAMDLNGVWNGTTSQEEALSFTVVDNAITSIMVGVAIPSCGVLSTLTTTFRTPQPIVDNAFSFTVSAGAISYTITGTFHSTLSAAGELQISFFQSFPLPCLGSAVATWTATQDM